MSSHRMLILGGTGEVGRQAVAAALADARVSHVLSFGRRPPPVPADAPGHEKLQHTSLDFDALLAEVRQGYDGSEAKKLSGSDADSVVIALGTTRANAGSAEAFELIDREYVLAAAKAARVPEKTQTVVYVSSGGANSSSWFLYPKSKGLTEEGIAALDYSTTCIYRPGLLLAPGGRAERRIPEYLSTLVIPHLPMGKTHLSIPTPVVGRALVESALTAAKVGKEIDLKGHKATLVDNQTALALGDQKA
ncbi:hypothetical protein JCM8115_004128 [Rhodotorula mucilaginosa]|nr:hypothetical protein B0A53_04648 [Rhodotorula sp. CCFEE 5036]